MLVHKHNEYCLDIVTVYLAIEDLLDVLEQPSDLTASNYWRLGLKLALLKLESTHSSEDLG